MTLWTWLFLLIGMAHSQVKPLNLAGTQMSCKEICKEFLPDGAYSKFKAEMTGMGAQQMALVCDGVNVNTELGSFRGKNETDASTALSQNCSTPVSGTALDFIEKQDWLGSSTEFQKTEKKDYTKQKDGAIACRRAAKLQQLCAMKGSQLEAHCENYNLINGAGSMQGLVAYNSASIALLGTAVVACGAACALANIEPVTAALCTGAGLASEIAALHAQSEISKSPIAQKLKSWENADKAMVGVSMAGTLATAGGAAYTAVKGGTTAAKLARAGACATATTSGILLAFKTVNMDELLNAEKRSCKAVKDLFDPNFKSIQEMHALPSSTPSSGTSTGTQASTSTSSGTTTGTSAASSSGGSTTSGVQTAANTPVTGTGANGVSFSGPAYDSLKRAAEGVTDPTEKQNILTALESGSFKPGTGVERALLAQNVKAGKAMSGLQGRILDRMNSMPAMAAVGGLAPASMQGRLAEMEQLAKDPANRGTFLSGLTYAPPSGGGGRVPSSQEINPFASLSNTSESSGVMAGLGLTAEVLNPAVESQEDQDIFHTHSKYTLFEIVSRRNLAITPRMQ